MDIDLTHSSAYHPIADLLRTRILDGTYPPGTPLPSENTLCNDHQCEHGTVRRALQVLQGEGLIIKTRGRRTTVVPLPQRHTLALHPGSTVTARMPMRPELDTLACTAATPLLVVTSADGNSLLYPADRTRLVPTAGAS